MNRDQARLRADLLAFYDQRRRALPWRDEADPYRVLVSEVMLQQTRVEAVREYYGAWLSRFPDLETLADADEEVVLKAWEGLGYYRRARNLHRTAREIRARYGGRIPSEAAELRTLPGVGAYTAGAVASIAFGRPEAAVDGNVRRVLARLWNRPEPTAAWLRDRATELLDADRPGDWNQAMMELGATVCVPRRPACDACPVAWACRAREAGTVAERPRSKRRAGPRKALVVLAAIVRRDGAVLLERREAGGLLGGMWALPERETEGVEAAEAVATEVAAAVLGGHRLGEASWRRLPDVRHRFTHLDVTYLPWLFEVEVSPAGGETLGAGPASRWVDARMLDRLPVPVAQRKVMASFGQAR